jgi:hypothetical protein
MINTSTNTLDCSIYSYSPPTNALAYSSSLHILVRTSIQNGLDIYGRESLESQVVSSRGRNHSWISPNLILQCESVAKMANQIITNNKEFWSNIKPLSAMDIQNILLNGEIYRASPGKIEGFSVQDIFDKALFKTGVETSGDDSDLIVKTAKDFTNEENQTRRGREIRDLLFKNFRLQALYEIRTHLNGGKELMSYSSSWQLMEESRYSSSGMAKLEQKIKDAFIWAMENYEKSRGPKASWTEEPLHPATSSLTSSSLTSQSPTHSTSSHSPPSPHSPPNTATSATPLYPATSSLTSQNPTHSTPSHSPYSPPNTATSATPLLPKERNCARTLFLGFFTCGLYLIYLYFSTRSEIRDPNTITVRN